ncbi:MAG: fructosamine kinase family protein [Chloroflexaceae bacterium]|nr:fructosamine kinase family protein [Chloroflexaceae bacterium]
MNALWSEPLAEAIGNALRDAGDAGPVRTASPVGGGCINHVLRLQTDGASYLLKWHPQAPPTMFAQEAQGLALLREAQSVRIPTVIAVAESTTEHPAYLLLEWIDPHPAANHQQAQALLGTQLATIHRQCSAPAYGLDQPNYLGSTLQPNDWHHDWVVFFRERRLRPQLALAQQQGLLPVATQRALERLLERLENWLGGYSHTPALIHGDLWGGNVLIDRNNQPVLIDPAVSYSDREAELAYTELFGGFHPAFYQAYQATWPTSPGRTPRRDIYNLYHLLNHLNIFGTSYLASIEHIVRHYLR